MSPSKGGNGEKFSWKELRKIYRKIREDIIELSQCVEPITFPEELERQVNSNNLTDFELADFAVLTPDGIHYNFLGGCLLFLLEILFEHISKDLKSFICKPRQKIKEILIQSSLFLSTSNTKIVAPVFHLVLRVKVPESKNLASYFV
nr:hypothetical protein HmN_000632000 [Hymenolepis microstoma]